eukprot:1157976-Pelagomonas_calceolata.AAC.7
MLLLWVSTACITSGTRCTLRLTEDGRQVRIGLEAHPRASRFTQEGTSVHEPESSPPCCQSPSTSASRLTEEGTPVPSEH